MFYSIVIDQGTSGTKASIVSSEGTIIYSETTHIPTDFSINGFVEQDPWEILTSTYSALNRVIDDYIHDKKSFADLISIGISNQRESFLIWDGEGNPITNVISWQCKRSTEICSRLKDKNSLIHKITGLRLDPYFSGTKLIWLLENNDKVRNTYTSGQAYFGTIDTWLIYNLTNKKNYYTDYTNASRTLLFDIKECTWSKEIIKMLDIEAFNFPKALTSDSIFGYTNINDKLPESLPIIGVMGDSQAACVGEGLFESGNIKTTMGTGSSIIMNTDELVYNSSGMVSTICWCTKEKVSYGLEGIIVSCGATLNWLINEMKLADSYQEIDRIAEKTPDSNPVTFIPAFSGLGAPYWKMQSKASLLGINFGVNREKIIRAIVESYPFLLYDIVKSFTENSKTVITCLQADGGLTNSTITLQIISDILQVKVLVDKQIQASTIGIAMFSFLGSNVLSFSEIRGLFKKRKYDIYYPSENNKSLTESYRLWTERIAEIKE